MEFYATDIIIVHQDAHHKAEEYLHTQRELKNSGKCVCVFFRSQQDPGEMMEVEDNESYVPASDPQNGERRNIQAEASVPEPTHTLTATTDSGNELGMPFIFKVSACVCTNLYSRVCVQPELTCHLDIMKIFWIPEVWPVCCSVSAL